MVEPILIRDRQEGISYIALQQVDDLHSYTSLVARALLNRVDLHKWQKQSLLREVEGQLDLDTTHADASDHNLVESLIKCVFANDESTQSLIMALYKNQRSSPKTIRRRWIQNWRIS